jgi:hypothetical protein
VEDTLRAVSGTPVTNHPDYPHLCALGQHPIEETKVSLPAAAAEDAETASLR